MNMNLYWHELRAGFKSLLVWTGILGLLQAEAMVEFSAYANNSDLQAVLDAMPPSVLQAFNLNAFNLTTLTGFYGVLFLYLGLLGAVAAGMWGSEILAREERRRTAEFLLALPLNRSRIFATKWLAALTRWAAFVLAVWLLALGLTAGYGPDESFYRFLRLEMQAIFFIGLFFLAFGLGLAGLLSQPRRVTALTLGAIMVTYVFAAAANLHEKLDFLRHFTPFKYFDAADLLRDGRLDETSVALTLIVVTLMLALGGWRYTRRDPVL